MIADIPITQSIQQGDNAALEKALAVTPGLADSVTSDGVSLLLFAVYCKNPSAVGLLKRYKTSLTIYEAVCTGEFDIVSELIEQRPEWINIPSADGFSILGYACFFNQLFIATYLVEEKGANVNLASSNRFKVAPIHSACAIGSEPLARLLLDNGADVNARQQGGFTPLFSAVNIGSVELVTFLLERGADIHARTDDGDTVLSIAEKSPFPGMVTFLQSRLAGEGDLRRPDVS